MSHPVAPADPAGGLPRFAAVRASDIPAEVRASRAKFAVDVPAGTTRIDAAAFYKCTELTQIALPAALTEIEGSAFCGCTGLTQLALPDELTEIGEGAFAGCTGLTQLALPDEITWIRSEGVSEAFWGCTGLAGTVVHITAVCAPWYVFDANQRLAVTIPAGTTEIANSAFEGCTGLVDVSFEAAAGTLVAIRAGAFRRCTRLTSVVLPDAVRAVEQSAFDECIGLVAAVLPGALVELGEAVAAPYNPPSPFHKYQTLCETGAHPPALPTRGAFKGCTHLAALVAPAAVVALPAPNFEGCVELLRRGGPKLRTPETLVAALKLIFWRQDTHALLPARAQAAVRTLLLAVHRLVCTGRLVVIPAEMVHTVLEHLRPHHLGATD